MRENDAFAMIEAFEPRPKGARPTGATRIGRPMALSAALSEAMFENGAPEPIRAAVGAAPGEGRNDWKVAIRAWTQTDAKAAVSQMRALKVPSSELDVRVTGRVRAIRPAASAGYAQRKRPLTPGFSAGHHAITAGTLGAFVQDPKGTIFALSNNHVFANVNAGRIGDRVLQPGPLDGGAASDAVLKLSKFVRIKTRGNLVDAALARPIEGHVPDTFELPRIGPVRGSWTSQPTERRVRKVGRTTGYTEGRITSLNLRNQPVDFDGQVAYFDRVIEVEGTSPRPPVFCEGGDSGSLVVDAAGYAVGLLFAGDDTGITFLNPIADVLSQLDVELVR